MTTMTNRSVDDFSDMDDLDSAQTRNASPAQLATIPCPKCMGSGKFTFGYHNVRTETCLQCKGSGQVRADWQKRREAFKKGEATKAAKLAHRAFEWQEAYPGEWKWISAASERGFDFARSMEQAVTSYGSLTPRQLAAVQSCMEKDQARQADRAKAQADRGVAVTGGSTIAAALAKATVAGRKAPKIRTETANFSLAKPHSANAGCVYVVAPDDTYLGKITPEGVFLPSRDCSEDAKLSVARVSTNALAEAVEYGKRTGRCSCCGRELTDPASIAAGIGPICAAGYF